MATKKELTEEEKKAQAAAQKAAEEEAAKKAAEEEAAKKAAEEEAAKKAAEEEAAKKAAEEAAAKKAAKGKKIKEIEGVKVDVEMVKDYFKSNPVTNELFFSVKGGFAEYGFKRKRDAQARQVKLKNNAKILTLNKVDFS